jgi:hypothetical protein
MFILQGLNFVDLRQVVSAPRLSSYEMLTATGSPGPNLGAYLWGLELAAAFGPVLSVLEVALRNKLDQAASAHFARADWIPYVLRHAGDRQWLADTKADPLLAQQSFRSTASMFNKKTILVAGVPKKLEPWKSPAEQKYEQLKKGMTKKGIPLLAPNIVANAMFGLWVDMFHPSFAGPSVDSLWAACESKVLPGLGTVPFATIASDLKAALAFRNRNFHHEPVWRIGPAMTPLKVEVHLTALIERIERAIGALSRDMLLALSKAGFFQRLRWLATIDAINAFADCNVPAAHDGDHLQQTVADILAATCATALPPIALTPHRAVAVAHHGKPAALIVGLG